MGVLCIDVFMWKKVEDYEEKTNLALKLEEHSLEYAEKEQEAHPGLPLLP